MNFNFIATLPDPVPIFPMTSFLKDNLLNLLNDPTVLNAPQFL